MSAVEQGKALVEGERQESYGHPLDNFTRIARLWSVMLDKKLAPGQEVSVEDVGYMMALLKIAREVNKPNPDNPVDVAGYMHCLTLIDEERGRRFVAKVAAEEGRSMRNGFGEPDYITAMREGRA